ncbi:MarR family transcriptional regulator [Cupriavidus sp. SW-Y-13]|nr:MarR family transcriptional regulator [Cupriavidus sp. SW-Y-13]
MRRMLLLVTMALSALASELGGAGHRCVFNAMPGQTRPRKEDDKPS